mmetsp:Transcript_10247/g.14068  ORF Transcript_10247/g.14068 Transcript_10247/m.14068 type:complete len:220 (+) Transcript_10247:137-796(+)|eukprot:CAMPEP_0176377294 /NCGR_PEP_ID=MMETSP0126-20121128/28785_1 /TAXON_ID=141414 ORGANISM="Strombidinopsis acuminatum, Strain SPMC142" /NCGR_SAMPLE_ID=MMETSP0126 /ASSEMBLY_ACC=CAM_ASM_000229 /LENGTH=219 /DNA_ID=CAMNT_0017739069 /DNA_START=133 /DNA_END=792 /DNA_ORIENTATION=-
MNVERMAMIEKDLKQNILTVKCDVTLEDDVKNAIEKTVATWGAVHVALCSAGVAWVTPTLTSRGPLNMDVFKKVVAINLFGTAHVAKYASIAMSKNKPVNDRGEKGVIVMVSSVAAEEGQRGQTAYSATKGSINGIVLPMARDLGKYGIRVLAVAPGIFATPMSGAMPQKVIDRLNADTPLGRPGQPDEFAHMVQTCIENGYLNGVHLRVDGAIKFSNL